MFSSIFSLIFSLKRSHPSWHERHISRVRCGKLLEVSISLFKQPKAVNKLNFTALLITLS